MNAAVLALLLLSVATAAGRNVTINRHNRGDVFAISGEECTDEACWNVGGGVKAAPTSRRSAAAAAAAAAAAVCQCHCPRLKPVFREDIRQCVDNIDECPLADYVHDDKMEKIPFVFLPAKGQLIKANAEIALSDVLAEGESVVSPVCVVSKVHYLSSSGWISADGNGSSYGGEDSGVPAFGLYRHSEKTYLQWLGGGRLSLLLEGRIVLITLLCKDVANARVGVFSPCVAFRVAGSPGFGDLNVLTAGEGDGAARPDRGQLETDFVVIGISGGLLAVLAASVSALVAFACYRRRRKYGARAGTKSSNQLLVNDGSIRINPLTQAPGPHHNYNQDGQATASFRFSPAGPHRQSLAVQPGKVNGTYFDPQLLKAQSGNGGGGGGGSEFFSRLRGMIDVARTKMASRRFMPSLIDIPEEYGYASTSARASTSASHPATRHPSTASSHEEARFRIYYSAEKRRRAAAASVASPESPTLYDSLTRKISSLKRSVARQLMLRTPEADDKIPAVEFVRRDATAGSNPPDVISAAASHVTLEMCSGGGVRKSPLPARKKTLPATLATPAADASDSIYFHPFIDDIYRSMDTFYNNPATTLPTPPTPEDADVENPAPAVTSSDVGALYAASTRTPQRNADELASAASAEAVYNCSNSVDGSLTRMLPEENEMEVANQLYNVTKGAKTLPRFRQPVPEDSPAADPEAQASATVKDKAHEYVMKTLAFASGGVGGMRSGSFRQPELMIGGVERKAPVSRHNSASVASPESFSDSLERSSGGDASAASTIVSVQRGTVMSLCQVYSSRKHHSETSATPSPMSLPATLPLPPLPPPKKDSTGTIPPLIPQRGLKPVAAAAPPEAPTLPPKNLGHKMAPPPLPPPHHHRPVPPPPPTPPEDSSLRKNVLQRIADIEKDSGGGGASGEPDQMTKGMQIALALRARVDLEGTMRNHRKSRSVKKSWRKLLDRMEDTFSEDTLSPSSTLRRKGKRGKQPPGHTGHAAVTGCGESDAAVTSNGEGDGSVDGEESCTTTDYYSFGNKSRSNTNHWSTSSSAAVASAAADSVMRKVRTSTSSYTQRRPLANRSQAVSSIRRKLSRNESLLRQKHRNNINDDYSTFESN